MLSSSIKVSCRQLQQFVLSANRTAAQFRYTWMQIDQAAVMSTQCWLISAAVMLLQGSLAPQHTEIYLQLQTEYLKMVPDPLLAAMVANASKRTWLILQEVLSSLGPEMYWSRRRTLLVIRTMELQAAWLDSICLVCLACPILQTAFAACMQSASSKCLPG